jgi:acyl carrier protein
MPRTDLLRFFEQTLRLHEHSLTGRERLSSVPNWDSLTTLNFMVMVDRTFGVPLKGSRVLACETVDDLLNLIDGARMAA